MENVKRPNMGEGSVKGLLLKMALPAVLAQIVNLLYNIVDRIYIGHMPEVGGYALTGVGLFTPILMLITAFAMLCGSGGAPQAGIALGQGNKEKAEKIMGNCFALLMILAAALTVVFFFLAPTLLDLFGGSENTLPYATQYARIYILGSVFVLIVMGMNVFITAQGNAKIAMLTTVIGAAINIVLDPIFIFLFNRSFRISICIQELINFRCWCYTFPSHNLFSIEIYKYKFRKTIHLVFFNGS
jgi:Na+-driven multidrug efflux pump